MQSIGHYSAKSRHYPWSVGSSKKTVFDKHFVITCLVIKFDIQGQDIFTLAWVFFSFSFGSAAHLEVSESWKFFGNDLNFEAAPTLCLGLHSATSVINS